MAWLAITSFINAPGVAFLRNLVSVKVGKIARNGHGRRGTALRAAPAGEAMITSTVCNLIWFAGFVFVGGSLIALWPDAREERRLAARYAGALAEA